MNSKDKNLMCVGIGGVVNLRWLIKSSINLHFEKHPIFGEFIFKVLFSYFSAVAQLHCVAFHNILKILIKDNTGEKSEKWRK